MRQQMDTEKETKRLKADTAAVAARAQRVRTELKEAEGMLETKSALKTYTPELLGMGKPGGGGNV